MHEDMTPCLYYLLHDKRGHSNLNHISASLAGTHNAIISQESALILEQDHREKPEESGLMQGEMTPWLYYLLNDNKDIPNTPTEFMPQSNQHYNNHKTSSFSGGGETLSQDVKMERKRSRAAEVRNLSVRRRRSRINEKLRALQQLLPRSAKTDKASMLDEAIDYFKSLQLQVHMLTTMMLLGVDPYQQPCMPMVGPIHPLSSYVLPPPPPPPSSLFAGPMTTHPFTLHPNNNLDPSTEPHHFSLPPFMLN